MSSDAAALHCPACGSEVPPQARLCHACGAQLARVPAGAAGNGSSAAELAAAAPLPVGIAPRGPWQDGTAVGLDSDAVDKPASSAGATVPSASAASPDTEAELDESSLPPEVLAILRAPPVQPSKLAGLSELGGGLTWPRVIGCLIGMALLAAMALATLFMLKSARQAQEQLAGQAALRRQLEQAATEGSGEYAPEGAGDPGASEQPAAVQPRQGGGGATEDAEAGAEDAGSGDSLF